MRSYPIIFSGPMVRALLEGRKTQTRRPITGQWANLKMHHDAGERCALYVRETWYRAENGEAIFRACRDTGLESIVDHFRKKFGEPWKPSIHLPRWASRLTLEVTDARKQRLQDISEEDAFAEGIDPETDEDFLKAEHYQLGGSAIRGGSPAVFAYASLWESLHGEASWDANPEVYTISFKVHHCNIDHRNNDAA